MNFDLIRHMNMLQGTLTVPRPCFGNQYSVMSHSLTFSLRLRKTKLTYMYYLKQIRKNHFLSTWNIDEVQITFQNKVSQ